jgi:osmotically-inducible protein OsmY
VLALLLLIASVTVASAIVQQPTAPDNSAHNKAHSFTADSQPNTRGDRLTTQKIRQAILADKDLSLYAHNVKVVTKNGAVTLQGPVKSDDEKQKVADLAASVVTTDKVTNRLTVK